MKILRLKRIINGNRILIVPLDHGVSVGPIAGLENIGLTLTRLINSKVDAIILNKGNIIQYGYILCENRTVSIFMHLNSSLQFSVNNHRKVLVASIEEAMRLGVDGVSIHINLGNEHDHEMLSDLGKISEKCNLWGMPLLAMMYLRGKNQDEKNPEKIKHITRVAAELGVDIIKINYTGEKQTFEQIVKSVDIPVVVAGGEYMDEHNLFNMAKDAIDAGAAGLAVGRNIFQCDNCSERIKYLKHLLNINCKKKINVN